MIKKILLTITLFALSYSILMIFSDDYTILDVSQIGQKRRFWCWAASTEMILKSFKNDPKFEQSNIARYNPKNTCEENNFCDSTCLDIECCTNNTLISPDYPSVLNKLGYISQASNGIPAFELLQNSIDNESPVLFTKLTQDTKNNKRLWNNHAVTVFGYLNGGSNNQWFFVRDPWEICKGCTYAFSYDILKYGNGQNISSLTPSEINPDDEDADTMSVFYNFKKPNIESYGFASAIKELKYLHKRYKHYLKKSVPTSQTFLSTDINITALNGLKNILKHTSQNDLSILGIKNGNSLNQPIEEKYISFKAFLKDFKNPYILPKGQTSRKTIALSFSNSEIILVQIDGSDFWRILGFSNCAWLPIVEKIAKEKIATHSIDINAITETAHISILSTQFQFYEFTSKENKYYLPRKNYPNAPFENKLFTEEEFSNIKIALLRKYDLLTYCTLFPGNCIK